MKSNILEISDENELRKIIVWLEQNKIKKYKSPNFMKINAQDWPKNFESYKNQLGCPTFSSRIEEVQWLLGYVIQQEYSNGRKDIICSDYHHFKHHTIFRGCLFQTCSRKHKICNHTKCDCRKSS